MKKIYCLILFLIFSIYFVKPATAFQTGQLTLSISTTEPVSLSPYVKVYVRRFSIPSAINVTSVSGSITLISGLPYTGQGALGVWYNSSGICPEDGSVYPKYEPILQDSPGAIGLIWINTISSKPGTAEVSTEFQFPVKRPMSGCGFMTFDLATAPNGLSASSGLTLKSNIVLHYDTDNAVLPPPVLMATGAETCFGSKKGCNIQIPNSSGSSMYVTPITSPTFLWSLFGDVTAGVFTGESGMGYTDPPSGAWNASISTYIYQSCPNLPLNICKPLSENSWDNRIICGPGNFINEKPSDAELLFSTPITSYKDQDINLPVNKVFSTPKLLKPGNCLVSLTNFSSPDGGSMINNVVYALLQPAPGSISGSLDYIDCNSISGWAGDRGNPTSPIKIDLYIDGVGPSHFFSQATANIDTNINVCSALGSTLLPGCPYGYKFNTPSSLKDGKSHTISVYAINGYDNPKLPINSRILSNNAIVCPPPNSPTLIPTKIPTAIPTTTSVSIVSPYTLKTNTYKGQLHTHTTRSDGANSPAEVVTYYKNAGYNFISLTDHIYSGNLDITQDPGVPGILFIPGTEQTTPNYRHIGRINALNPKNNMITNPQTLIDSIQAENGIAILNHPHFPGGSIGDSWSTGATALVHGYTAIEVFNSLIGVTLRNAEDIWDNALTNNVKTWGIAADDCHKINQSGCLTAYIRVSANSLSKDEILNNIKSGNYYSAYTYPGESTDIKLIVSTSGNLITATTNIGTTIEFIGVGGLVKKTETNKKSASYIPSGTEKYIRIRATSGKSKAWSNPLFIETPLSTPTPTNIPRPTITPTKTPTATPTKVPTLTPTKINTPTPTPTSPPSSLCTQCPNSPQAKSYADADCSGITTINDISIWRAEFIAGEFGSTVKNTWGADFDCDGKVTLNDVSIWRENFIKAL